MANPLKNLAASLNRQEVLTPELKKFLLEVRLKKHGSHHDIVIEDARLTIATFRERVKAYNHGKEPEGEFFHPSRLAGCLRALWYDHFKAPHADRIDGEGALKEHLTFEFGTYAHVMFQNLCEQAGVLESREVAIQDAKLKILGHADGIVKIRGKRYLLEIKTSNSRNFIMLTAPKEGHRKQVHAYMKALGLTATVVIYLNKDTSLTKEYVIHFDQAFYEEHVADRIATFFKAVKTKTPPPKEGTNPNLMPCNYCGFQQVCYDTEASNKFLKSVKSLKP